MFKKFLSLFFKKAIEGAEYEIGFSYLFQDCFSLLGKKLTERTLFFCLPLPINRYGKYNYYGDEIKQGERWLSVVFCFRYIKFDGRRIFKPYVRFFWMPIGGKNEYFACNSKPRKMKGMQYWNTMRYDASNNIVSV